MLQMSKISPNCDKPICVCILTMGCTVDRILDFSGASVTGLNNNDTQIARGKVTLCFLPHDPFLSDVALCYVYLSTVLQPRLADCSFSIFWEYRFRKVSYHIKNLNVIGCLGVDKESWTGKANRLFESKHAFTTFSVIFQLPCYIHSV